MASALGRNWSDSSWRAGTWVNGAWQRDFVAGTDPVVRTFVSPRLGGFKSFFKRTPESTPGMHADIASVTADSTTHTADGS